MRASESITIPHALFIRNESCGKIAFSDLRPFQMNHQFSLFCLPG